VGTTLEGDTDDRTEAAEVAFDDNTEAAEGEVAFDDNTEAAEGLPGAGTPGPTTAAVAPLAPAMPAPPAVLAPPVGPGSDLGGTEPEPLTTGDNG